ncbi:MAG: YHS domain-containing protein [bacterium]|nr:YHS domain-containing protein [bacterium]
MGDSGPINRFCPNSGKPVVADSLTEYRGVTVGFCNPHCRDDFARDTESESTAKTYFDVLLKERS